MYDFAANRSQRTITFSDVKLSKAWSLKYFQQLAFHMAIIKIIINLENSSLVSLSNPANSHAADNAILSITGEIWVNGACVMCGQIQQALFDTDLKYNAQFQKLIQLWDTWHMNDVSPGTAEQMQVLQDAMSIGQLTRAQKNDVAACREYLADVGFLTDCGHTYGEGTIFHRIPPSVLQQLWEI